MSSLIAVPGHGGLHASLDQAGLLGRRLMIGAVMCSTAQENTAGSDLKAHSTCSTVQGMNPQVLSLLSGCGAPVAAG